jgi:hypothetical protein
MNVSLINACQRLSTPSKLLHFLQRNQTVQDCPESGLLKICPESELFKKRVERLLRIQPPMVRVKA